MSTFQSQCSMDVDHDDASSVHPQHVIDLTRSRSAPPPGSHRTHSIPLPASASLRAAAVAPPPPAGSTGSTGLMSAAAAAATPSQAVVMSVAKRYEQMKSETLPMEYRRERLCRLVYTSQLKNNLPDANYVHTIQGGVCFFFFFY